jgi:hypothetical protein
MGFTITPNLGLKKPEHRDPDTFESWEVVPNHNMELIDAAIGSIRAHTSQVFIQDGDSVSQSLDKLDAGLGLASTTTTQDQRDALAGEGIPSGSNKFATKSYVRMPRKFVITPEFPGVLVASPGGANIGIMDTDAEVNNNFLYGFYQWLSDQGSFQSYDLVVQWRIPETFLNFLATSNKALIVDICTQEADATNNKVDVILSKDGADSTTSSMLAQISTIWASEKENTAIIGFDAAKILSDLGVLLPGDTLNIRIRMYSKNSVWVKVGAITIQYVG